MIPATLMAFLQSVAAEYREHAPGSDSPDRLVDFLALRIAAEITAKGDAAVARFVADLIAIVVEDPAVKALFRSRSN
jgi:hypothetical protein